VQSVHITTEVVSTNPADGGVLDTTYVIKFVSDLPQVGGFLRVLLFMNALPGCQKPLLTKLYRNIGFFLMKI
jgi:hypothetical protein